MIERSAEYYANECFEIEAALESLINLSDIVEDIAIEAAMKEDNQNEKSDEPITPDKKKKNLAIKKMAEAWVEKFKNWGKKKLDEEPVMVPKYLDVDKVNKILTEMAKAYDSALEYGNYKGVKEKVESLMKEFKDELSMLENERGVQFVKRPGLFRAGRAKLTTVLESNAVDIENKDYSIILQDQISKGNELIKLIDRYEYWCRKGYYNRTEFDEDATKKAYKEFRDIDKSRLKTGHDYYSKKADAAERYAVLEKDERFKNKTIPIGSGGLTTFKRLAIADKAERYIEKKNAKENASSTKKLQKD